MKWIARGQGAAKKCPKCRKELFVGSVTLEGEGEATGEVPDDDEEAARLDSAYEWDMDVVRRECVNTGLDCTSSGLDDDEEKDSQPPNHATGS